MNKANKYYSLAQTDNSADIYIFGDITSWEWLESDVSSYTLSKELQGLDVDTINVHINSYGGEVAEGLAIYNTLKNHKAKITTVCDGFACSAASVIFMAGEERIMNNASLLMIHNVWTHSAGNAEELRKVANALDIMSQAAVNAYMEDVNITEDKLKELLDNETWLSAEQAVEMGFATSISKKTDNNNPSQSVRNMVAKMFLSKPDKNIDVNQLAEKIAEKLMQKQTHTITDPQEQPQENKTPENKTQKAFFSIFK